MARNVKEMKTEDLQAEAKAVLRELTKLQARRIEVVAELTARDEEVQAANSLAKMTPAKRAALEKVLAKEKAVKK